MRSLFRPAAAVLLGAAVALGAAGAGAQATRIVVGGPPGGNTDIAARLVLDRVAQELGTTVIVENRPGAGGTTAAELVKNARPDGSMIGLVTAANAANETIIKTKSFNLLTDLDPVGHYAWLANVLIVNKQLGAAALPQLVEVLKRRPDLSYGSGGIGSPGHLSGETFKQRAGVVMTHVPYGGAAPAVQAVLRGEVVLMFATASAAIGQITDGGVLALAVTSETRLDALPQVPTLAEAGLGSFDVRDWVGFVVPKGTPIELRDRLHRAFATAFADAGTRERLQKATIVAAAQPLGPAAFGEFLQREVTKLEAVVRQAGISPQ